MGQPAFPLLWVTQKEVSPVPDVDCAGRVVEEFARPVGGVASLGEASLKGFDLGVIHKVVCTLVTTGGRGKLAGKDGGPAGSTEDTGRVGIAEVNLRFWRVCLCWE